MSFSLYLDTREGVNINNNPADCVFTLNSFNTNLRNIRISLESCIIPNTVPAVNNNNNKVYFAEEEGATLTATLEPGNYTGTTLAVELKRVLDLAGDHTYSVSYNSSTNKLSITTTLPNVFGFRFSNTFQSSAHILGFPDLDSDNLSGFISSNPVRLDGNLYFDLVSNLGSNNMASSGRYSILARIAVNVPTGAIIFYDNQNNEDDSYINNDLNQIALRLYDDRGNLLQLDQSSHISYTLRIRDI
jgi:hypothetical protein